MLPWALDRHAPACDAYCVGGVRSPPARTQARRPAARSLGPRALGRQSFSALSGSEDRCCPLYPKAETTADRVRSQSEDCCAPLSPAPFGAGWSLARWLDPKIEPWPRRRTLPEGDPTTRRRLRRTVDTTAAAAPESASTPASRQRHPKVVPTTSKIHPRGFEAARPDPGFESTTLRAMPDSRRNASSRNPALHDDWAARRRTHSRRNASQRATRVPPGTACDSLRSTRRQLAWSGRTPKGSPWLPTPTRKPLGAGSGQTDIASMRKTGRDEVPTQTRRSCADVDSSGTRQNRVTHLVGGRRLGHRSARSEKNRSPSRHPLLARRDASFPVRRSARGIPGRRTGSGRWIETCRCSRQRAFPGKRSPR